MAVDVAATGTLLQLKIAGTYTSIGIEMELKGPEGELKMRKVTSLTDASEKKRPGLVDLGKLTGKLFFDPSDATHIAMRAKLYTPPAAPDEWKLVYGGDANTTHANDAFKGYLCKFAVGDIKPGETIEADFEIEITDTFTATAGTP